MENLTIIDHPLIQHKLTEMRKKTTSSNHDEVLSAMLGNAVENLYPNKSKKENADLALKFDNVTFSKNLYDLNFEVYKGEILGVFGLLGSGLEDLGRKIYGISGKTEKGKIFLFGKNYRPISPQDAKKNGIFQNMNWEKLASR